MKRLSWKYMAGLVDGEGCIDMQAHVDKRDGVFYCRPRLRITLSGKAGEMMIPNFLANFGGSKDSGKEPTGNWQQAHTWILTGATSLRKFLQNVVNHLAIKEEQARLAIWWLDHCGGKHVPEEVRRFAHEELKAMKADPQRLSERASAQIERMMRQSSIAKAM